MEPPQFTQEGLPIVKLEFAYEYLSQPERGINLLTMTHAEIERLGQRIHTRNISVLEEIKLHNPIICESLLLTANILSSHFPPKSQSLQWILNCALSCYGLLLEQGRVYASGFLLPDLKKKTLDEFNATYPKLGNTLDSAAIASLRKEIETENPNYSKYIDISASSGIRREVVSEVMKPYLHLQYALLREQGKRNKQMGASYFSL